MRDRGAARRSMLRPPWSPVTYCPYSSYGVIPRRTVPVEKSAALFYCRQGTDQTEAPRDCRSTGGEGGVPGIPPGPWQDGDSRQGPPGPADQPKGLDNGVASYQRLAVFDQYNHVERVVHTVPTAQGSSDRRVERRKSETPATVMPYDKAHQPVARAATVIEEQDR